MALWRLYMLSVMLLWASSSSSHTTVAPPQELQITDPGLLGSLDIEWKPPPQVQAFNECTVEYKLQYRSAGDRDWKVIFTRKLKFRVGFDLSRSAEVKVQTLLRGRCTDEVELQSDWIDATFQLPLQGNLESEVQNFHCIYHDWEYLKCTWQPGLLAPRGVHYGLYYWYEGLGHAVQCEDYIQDHGINTGCTLQNLSQAEYKDLSICVNGSAAATLLRPLYATLRLHNLAKPSAPKQLVVSMSAAEELHVAWSPPDGETPPQCLEYEIQLAEDQEEAKAAWVSVSTQLETALTISRAKQSHIPCVRVRGRTNLFCADQGFWSEWTQECFSVSRKGEKQLFILIPVILSLSSSLILLMLIGQCKKSAPIPAVCIRVSDGTGGKQMQWMDVAIAKLYVLMTFPSSLKDDLERTGPLVQITGHTYSVSSSKAIAYISGMLTLLTTAILLVFDGLLSQHHLKDSQEALSFL